ncbi:hypothetical protein TNCT_404201 [Trichonephila clavata]|uniref:Uncharacterized protein n=1 Tax=Trichonephila clavata TaxID=2740835 RepID=A0A8X6HC25_TRICU|nr:hypothetical protein TNCT_404201 [Trichonephila clavata]
MSLLNNTMPPTCPWTAGYLLNENASIHTTKRGLKLSMNILRFDEHTGFLRQAVLETSRQASYSFRECREKYCFPPLPPPWISFQQSSTRHVSLDYKACFKPVNGPLRHFKTQWIPLRNETVQDAHSKSPYTKAGPLLGSQCPDLISRGNLFEPSLPRSHSLFNKLCFNVSWTTEDLSG